MLDERWEHFGGNEILLPLLLLLLDLSTSLTPHTHSYFTHDLPHKILTTILCELYLVYEKKLIFLHKSSFWWMKNNCIRGFSFASIIQITWFLFKWHSISFRLRAQWAETTKCLACGGGSVKSSAVKRRMKKFLRLPY